MSEYTKLYQCPCGKNSAILGSGSGVVQAKENCEEQIKENGWIRQNKGTKKAFWACPKCSLRMGATETNKKINQIIDMLWLLPKECQYFIYVKLPDESTRYVGDGIHIIYDELVGILHALQDD